MSQEKTNNDTESTPKRLYRSRHDRMLAGVCGGIADYLNVESVLVRIIWVVLTLLGGMGLLMYIASVIIIPENPEEIGEEEQKKKGDEKTLFWGALLIIIGVGLLLKQFGFFHYFNFWSVPWQLIWAIFLILVGIFLLYNRESVRYFKGAEAEDESDGADEKQAQIYRSRENRMLSGVCGGLAEYFKIDPTIVRLVYLFLTLASVGIGIIAYIIMVIVFPEKPYENDSSAIERKI